MTKHIRHCAWCGGAIPDTGSVGRPRRYCRRSHRQRAFEARRSGRARGLGAGEAVVRAEALRALGDARYLLEAALDDTTSDLAADPGEAASAYDALAAAAREVLAVQVEAVALGDDASPP
ncbi:MAG: hypothetical protein KQH83_06955 [Actinobacteria bacterium]|nr:hypothetical protein [Actinomycetota bacterium]